MGYGYGYGYGYGVLVSTPVNLASFTFTGTLAPVGTEGGRLLNTGTEANAVVASGGATQLSVGQTITPTFTSSNYVRYYKDDVLVEDTTTGQTSYTLTGDVTDPTFRDFYALETEPTQTQKDFMESQPEKTFAHFDSNQSVTESVLSGLVKTSNLPLNRIGQEQIDYAQAFGSERIAEGDFESTNGWNVQSGWSITGGQAVVNSASTAYLARTDGQSFEENTSYVIELDIDSISSGAIRVQNNLGQLPINVSTAGIHKAILNNTTGTNLQILGVSTPNAVINSISVRQATAYDIENWTTSCDITKQETGIQLSQFEKSGGIVGAYKPDRIWFDGGEYVAMVGLDWLPSDTEDWVLESIITHVDSAEFCGRDGGGSTYVVFIGSYGDGSIYTRIGTSVHKRFTATYGLHHVVMVFRATGTYDVYIDGLLKEEESMEDLEESFNMHESDKAHLEMSHNINPAEELKPLQVPAKAQNNSVRSLQ